MRQLREEIRNAEISGLVLEGINGRRTAEEDNAYYEAIEVTLQKYQVSLESIVLANNNGKKITLANIWPGENDKKTAKNRG